MRSKPRLGLALVASFLPFVVEKDGCDDHGAYDQEADLQFAHGQAAAGSSRSFNASSMSTATTLDTPRSCMVTPISWCAISMVILLWLMNRNWVCCDIFTMEMAHQLIGVTMQERGVSRVSWCAISMVILLWLMNRNWVISHNKITMEMA